MPYVIRYKQYMFEKEPRMNWLSLADMMTGLMLVFLLIAILFISQTQSNIQKYKSVKSEIYQELKEAFKTKEEAWQMTISEKNLTIVFNNPRALFRQDSSIITSDYKEILDEFIPVYLGIINKDEYRDNIREVRIEGHTANTSAVYNSYISTVKLSQDRAREILKYIRGSKTYMEIDSLGQAKFEFWFTANGYGKGRAVDSSGDFVHDSNEKISQKSRRVEFRIVTNSEQLIDEIFRNIK